MSRLKYAWPIGSALLLFLSVPSTGWCQQLQTPGLENKDTSALSKPTPASSTIEHWDVLPLAENSLHAGHPVFGEKDKLPTFTRELIRVQWRADDPIDLYILRPANVVKPPVVLFLYSFPSETDKFRSDALCQALVKQGFAAVGFVSALTGQRYHDRPMKEWFISELPESLGSSVHDVQMILNYLATRNDFDMERVGMFGQGSGGSIAILSAAVDSRIKVVDVMDPWGDWPDWLAKSPVIPESERANYLKADFLESVARLDPVQWLTQLKGRPLRVQENLFNLAMPEAVRKHIEAAASGGAQVVEYRDIKEYSEKVSANGKMLEWMQSQLQGASETITAEELRQKTVAAENNTEQKH
jgi:hypothetical protein